jgi:hypothetical protein
MSSLLPLFRYLIVLTPQSSVTYQCCPLLCLLQLTQCLLAATAECRGLLCGSSTDPASSSSGTVVTRPGLFDTAPDINVKLLAPGPRVCVALTGPDKGVVGLPLLHKQQQTQAQQHPAAAGELGLKPLETASVYTRSQQRKSRRTAAAAV